MPIDGLPIVDFSAYSLGVEKTQVGLSKESYQDLADSIYHAFSTIGFLYLKNHGISQQQIDEAMSTSASFFSLPTETKEKYLRGDGLKNHGWVPNGREKLIEERPACLKEVFDVNPLCAEFWPDKEVPDFKPAVNGLLASCRQLASRLLELMAMGLKLPDPEYFNKCHRPDRPSYTALRSLYYPSITRDTVVVKPKQIRCSEHTDYGSLTVLFQDDAGGLEVWDREGEKYVPAPYIPGTLIINLGDLMQRWTADRLVSTKHRVMNPSNEDILTRPQPRQSIACFFHPEADCLIECADGSNKYPPILEKDYLDSRFYDTFKELHTCD